MSLILPLNDWPVADVEMWGTLQREGGPLDDCGALMHLRATSLKMLQCSYGQWLKYLSERFPEAISLPPAARATVPHLQCWLGELENTAPMTRLMLIGGMLRVLRAAEPDRDWSVQNRLVAGLRHAAGRGDLARKAGRIASSLELLRAGSMRARGHANAASTHLQAMIRLRDGTMIAMLALMPMRRRAFANLILGYSIHISEEAVFVSLPSELTKSGVPWEAEVPEQVAPLLRRYISEARTYFLNRGGEKHDILWVDKKGRPVSDNYIGQRIGKLTLELIGKRVPPHFFRDAAATTLTRISPEATGIIPAVLGHTGFGTAERHYIHARSIEAGRSYKALLDKKKRSKR